MKRKNTNITNFDEIYNEIKNEEIKKIYKESFKSAYNLYGKEYNCEDEDDCIDLLRNEAGYIVKLHQGFNEFLIKFVLKYNNKNNKSYYSENKISLNIENNKKIFEKINNVIDFAKPEFVSNKYFIEKLKDLKEIDECTLFLMDFMIKNNVSNEYYSNIIRGEIFKTIILNYEIMKIDENKMSFKIKHLTYKQNHQKNRADLLLEREWELLNALTHMHWNSEINFKNSTICYGVGKREQSFILSNINMKTFKLLKFYNKKIRQIKNLSKFLILEDNENNAKLFIDKNKNKNAIPELIKYIIKENLIYSGAENEILLYELIRNLEAHGFNALPYLFEKKHKVEIFFQNQEIFFKFGNSQKKINQNEFLALLKEKSLHDINPKGVQEIIQCSNEKINDIYKSPFTEEKVIESYIFQFLWSTENRNNFIIRQENFLKNHNINITKIYNENMSHVYYTDSYPLSVGHFWLLITRIVKMLDNSNVL